MNPLRIILLFGAAVLIAGSGFLGADQTRSVWDGVYTEAQAKRGQEIYDRQCSGCHGDTLMGGDDAPALAGDAFLANWNGMSVGDIFVRIRRTMPEDEPGKLTPQQNSDIVAHLLSANHFPAGKAELDTQAETLKQIKFESAKPQAK
jgi:mono/diheme cytochrome c family protein